MIIIHGENLLESRKALQIHIDSFLTQNFTIERLDAKNLTQAILEETLGKQSLFESERVLIIESLHSLQTSKLKNTLITMVSESSEEIILWEKRSLTKTMLKKFPSAKEQSFPISKKMFAWLDSLGSSDNLKKHQLLKETIDQEDEYLAFIMLIRQIRLLILVKETGSAPGAPFMVGKLSSQAKKFTLKELLNLHQILAQMDRAMKTSRLAGTLSQQLDLLTIAR